MRLARPRPLSASPSRCCGRHRRMVKVHTPGSTLAVAGARSPHLLSEQSAPGSSVPGCTWLTRRSHAAAHVRPVPTGRPERPPRAVLGTCASPPPAKSPTAFDPSGGGGHEAGRRRAQRAELAPALGAPHGTEAPKCRLLPMHVSGTRSEGTRGSGRVTHGTMIWCRVMACALMVAWYSSGSWYSDGTLNGTSGELASPLPRDIPPNIGFIVSGHAREGAKRLQRTRNRSVCHGLRS